MSDTPHGEPQGFRQDMVEEAYKFLINPKVVGHSEERKSAFLRKKGLSDEEISAAFAKAQTYGPAEKARGAIQGGNMYQGAVVPAYPMPAPPSLWVKVRDVCNVILILTGAAYGLHYVFQRYVGPWLTGRRQKTVEESMVELQQSVVSVLKEVQTTLASLEKTLTAQNTHIQALNREGSYSSTKQLEQLKTEVASLKGLLINKRTFPSTPSPAPSIPSWQRNKAAEKPVEAPAEPGVSVSNQAEGVGEGESLSSPPSTQEAASSEAKDVIDETAAPVAMRNGQVSENGMEGKCEGDEKVPIEAH